MECKVILDADPGIDTAAALLYALLEPQWDVVAVTGVAGRVDAELATRNVQLVIEQLDPPRLPRIGAARDTGRRRSAHVRPFHGSDGLGGCNFVTSELHHRHSSEKVIIEAVRNAPHQVTLICLGPLTNLAAALERDAELAYLLKRVIICGGTICAPGNVTPTAEANIHADVPAAQAVLEAPVAASMIPLDVTRALRFELDFLDVLPPPHTRAGRLLGAMLPFLYRAYHDRLGLEHVYLDALVALAAAAHRDLVTWDRYPCQVEGSGDLTFGQTVFDRRPGASRQSAVEVATGVQSEPLMARIVAGLQRAGS